MRPCVGRVCYSGGGALMAYLLVVVGGLMALTPGFLDPINAPVNGLTLLGVMVMVSGVVVAVRQQ